MDRPRQLVSLNSMDHLVTYEEEIVSAYNHSNASPVAGSIKQGFHEISSNTPATFISGTQTIEHDKQHQNSVRASKFKTKQLQSTKSPSSVKQAKHVEMVKKLKPNKLSPVMQKEPTLDYAAVRQKDFSTLAIEPASSKSRIFKMNQSGRDLLLKNKYSSDIDQQTQL